MTSNLINQRAVGTFPTRQATEQALLELRDAGFPMGKVSVITRDGQREREIAGVDVQNSVGNEAAEGAGAGAVTGTVLGSIGGLLVGLGTLVIPGAGPFLAAGTVATTLAGAGIGAAGGALVGALTGLGIPEREAEDYSQRLSQGEYLVIVDGSDDEIRRAEAVLRRRHIQAFGIYNAAEHQSTGHQGREIAPGVTDAEGRYSDRSTLDRDIVEVIDHRQETR